MDRSDADQLNILIHPVTADNRRVNSTITLPARVSSGLAAVVSVFCIGLVSGAAGGLLLGGTAVITLQSLELLADNRLLMNQLKSQIRLTYNDYYSIEHTDIHISVLAVIFGVFSSTLSLAAGIYIGSSTYSLVIKKKGEAAMGKALMWAGPICLMGVTATGYIVGLTLESFLSISFYSAILLWFAIPVVVAPMIQIIDEFWFKSDRNIFWGFIQGAAWCASVSFYMRSNLLAVFTPIIASTAIIVAKVLKQSQFLTLTTAPVPLMLITSDVYNTVGQQIVSLSPTFTNISSAVVEAIFVGVLASQMWSVTVGMLLFMSWQKGGTFKICATAAGFSTAVLGAIKMTLPVLGPGPTIGALIGVAGAVGVSLSAGVAAADQYGLGCYGIVGRLGLTVGAPVGAFLSSSTHSGLSGMFMALCAATIPAGAFTILFLRSKLWILFVCFWMCLYTVFISLTHTFWYNSVLCVFSLGCVYIYMLFLL
ncbi:uncharacterized protein LOC104929896 [Larimichthys crocea]|uniref:uncharacterized protein LOC104929896 n=1 Tax=Larimichthys crocea TaxID=215358 RepID=UPI000F5F7958|nr:uncharacterized protein LOC104929896 [Larimichthys crocea]